jgi:hypothetical protein
MAAFIVTQTGVVIEYPRAGCIKWINEANHYAELHLANEGGFICKVPRGCVVSFDRPTTVQQAQNAMRTSLADSLEVVTACVENIELTYTNKKRLKALKKSLSRFDTRSGCWKKVKP